MRSDPGQNKTGQNQTTQNRYKVLYILVDRGEVDPLPSHLILRHRYQATLRTWFHARGKCNQTVGEADDRTGDRKTLLPAAATAIVYLISSSPSPGASDNEDDDDDGPTSTDRVPRL